MKRSSCGADGKCSVFKAGLCIDLGQDVWSSTLNTAYWARSIADAKGGMIAEAVRFGKLAKALLKKHNNRLPKRCRFQLVSGRTAHCLCAEYQ